jgi:uncharacterized membrane protein YgcG
MENRKAMSSLITSIFGGIGNYILPQFKKDTYYSGLKEGIRKIKKEIE